MDCVNICVRNNNPDILVISETWLNSSIRDTDVTLNGYSIHRCYRLSKGGGVAIYVRSNIKPFTSLCFYISKQYELFAVKLDLSHAISLFTVDIYHPPCTSSIRKEKSREISLPYITIGQFQNCPASPRSLNL